MSTRKLEAALRVLLDMIENGREYPDAHTDVCSRFGLTISQGEMLQGMYDASQMDVDY